MPDELQQTVVDDETPPPPAPADETPLSESDDIFKIPLHNRDDVMAGRISKQSKEIVPDTAVDNKQESVSESNKEASPNVTPSIKDTTKDQNKSTDFKPEFEGAAKTEIPFKSKEAEEIRSEQPPKGVHAENWNKAKTKWAGIVEAKDQALHKAQKEHQEALAALVKKAEDLESRVSSLAGYESVIDYQATDKFKKEIEEPLNRAESSMIDWAKSWASEDGIKELTSKIKDDGYLDAALVQLQQSRPDLALRFQMHMSKIIDLRERRTLALNEVKANHQKFVDERRSQSATKMAQFETGIKSAIESHTKMFDNNLPMFPFLVKQRIPSGADPQIQAQVETHNKQVEENLRDLEAAVKSDDPNMRVRLAVGYMTAVQLQSINKQLHAELQKEREFNKSVKERSAVPSKASGGVSPSAPKEFDGPLSEYLDVKLGRSR